jgi:hypothetical protein
MIPPPRRGSRTSHPRLQLGGEIAVRQRLVAQQAICIVDQKPRRIEHHQHFGGQRFSHGLARFSRDGLRNF